MPALADWLHNRSFKLGLYTSAGNQTCSNGGRPIAVPGSRHHYAQDAASFASWGVDYVKVRVWLTWLCDCVKVHARWNVCTRRCDS
jgi:hypothetical protein